MKLSISTTDVQIIHNYNNTDKQKLCSGIVISAALTYFDVLSLCDSVVLQVNKNLNNKWTVIIQYDENNALKYNDLVHVNVRMGQAIKAGTRVGTVNKSMKIEYLTSVANPTFNPVRFGRLTYYIADPTDIILGNNVLGSDMPKYTFVEYDTHIPTIDDSDVSDEFKSNNSGGVT